jgi:Icc-related predicted phosphoesterase
MASEKKSKKTKVLAIGDIHEDKRLIKNLAKRAKEENVDLVILAGDLTFAENSAKGIVGPFIKEKKQVLLIPGNHESVSTVDFLANRYPNTKSIHGDFFIKENLGVFGAGGADIGTYQISESELFELLKKGNEKVKGLDKKIMVTHLHPHKTKSEFSGFKGSKSVRKAIDKFKPDIAIFAHIHEASGIEEKIGDTLLINVSRKEKIFEV